jgi:hypothetical protein
VLLVVLRPVDSDETVLFVVLRLVKEVESESAVLLSEAEVVERELAEVDSELAAVESEFGSRPCKVVDSDVMALDVEVDSDVTVLFVVLRPVDKDVILDEAVETVVESEVAVLFVVLRLVESEVTLLVAELTLFERPLTQVLTDVPKAPAVPPVFAGRLVQVAWA